MLGLDQALLCGFSSFLGHLSLVISLLDLSFQANAMCVRSLVSGIADTFSSTISS
jgi:hypothetical protein